MSENVYVCPLGVVDEDILEIVARSVVEFLKMPVRILPAMGEPTYAYDKRRGQYDSKRILKRLMANCPRGTFRIMGVTRVDLYVPILTFVFGAAQLSGRSAVISTGRLNPLFHQEPENRQLFLARVKKTAVHELGHSLGLVHCRDRRCVMFSSTRIEDTDLKESRFCYTCGELFKWHLDKVLRPAEFDV